MKKCRKCVATDLANIYNKIEYFQSLEGTGLGEALEVDPWELFETVYGEAPPEATSTELAERDLKRQLVENGQIWQRDEIIAEREALLEATGYQKKSEALTPDLSHNSFFIRTKDRIVHYKAKHGDTVEATNKDESAEFGVSQIGGRDVVTYVMNYEFFGGSLSMVAGEQFKRATEHSIKHDLPLLIINSTGGARQQENVTALYQMERLVDSLRTMKEKAPHLPIVNVVLGEVWGGIPASSFPLGDLRIAYIRSRMGFAGSRVISDSEGRTIPSGAQRVETHTLARNIDVLVSNTYELVDYLAAYFNHAQLPDKKNERPLESSYSVPFRTDSDLTRRGLQYEVTPVNPVLSSRVSANEIKTAFADTRPEQTIDEIRSKLEAKGITGDELELQIKAEYLMARYRNCLFDPSRIDAESIMLRGFDSFVPFYNRFYDSDKNIIYYPKIIAGVGRIGLQSFGLIGHQASYSVKEDGSMTKILALPEPADMKFQLRFMEFCNRLRLPLGMFCDTPGAQPSLEAEINGQFELIATLIDRARTHRAPVMSYITGLEGSGGGLVLAPRGDSLAMLSRGLMTVADPGAASVIVYKGNSPKQRADTIVALAPDADSQVRAGLLERTDIIQESPNPYATIQAIRDHLILTYGELSRLSERRLLAQRHERLHSCRGYATRKRR